MAPRRPARETAHKPRHQRPEPRRRGAEGMMTAGVWAGLYFSASQLASV